MQSVQRARAEIRRGVRVVPPMKIRQRKAGEIVSAVRVYAIDDDGALSLCRSAPGLSLPV